MNINRWIIRSLKSKTILTSAVLSMLGAAQASLGLFTSVLTPKVYGIVVMVIGVLYAGLRAVTTQPLKDK
jgi:xanthine/uracil permease